MILISHLRGPEDWVEAPSQMLENWCWEPKVLKKMTRHYKTQETMPSDMVEKLVKRLATILCL